MAKDDCPNCGGTGKVKLQDPRTKGPKTTKRITCGACNGTKKRK